MIHLTARALLSSLKRTCACFVGLFISLLVSDKSAPGPVSVSVPVSWPEMQVIRTLIEFSIPRFLGFDAVFHSSEQL